MSSSYLPHSDAALLAWADNFATLLTANPTQYGLSAPEALVVQNAYNAYETALAAATNPATRTTPTIQAKNNARTAMVNAVRPVAMFVRDNLAVPDELKLGLGLRIPDREPSPIPAPTTQPRLTVFNALARQHVLRFADATTPDRRGKPAGVAGLQLFCKVSPTNAAPPQPEDTAWTAYVSKGTHTVYFEAADAGKVAHYFARWQTRTGLVGPWSECASMAVWSSASVPA